MANHRQKTDPRAILITLMLREDHKKVTQLFDQYDATTNVNEKRDVVTAVLAALEVLTKLEEELIYPAWREYMDEQDVMDEALREHHVVHGLIEELKNMNPDDKKYSFKFTILSGHVKNRINEMEGKIFPQAERAELDWEGLTKRVMQRRQSLEQKTLWLLGVPVIFASETVRTPRMVLSRRSGC
ncbi:MAG: hemerythrin domain-containing protein [Nitrospirota bacterium]